MILCLYTYHQISLSFAVLTNAVESINLALWNFHIVSLLCANIFRMLSSFNGRMKFTNNQGNHLLDTFKCFHSLSVVRTFAPPLPTLGKLEEKFRQDDIVNKLIFCGWTWGDLSLTYSFSFLYSDVCALPWSAVL